MHLNRPIPSVFFAFLLTLCATVSFAQIQPDILPLTTPIAAYEIPQQAATTASFNNTRILTVALDMEPDWYAYGNIPGPMGRPTKLTATTQDGTLLRVIYPTGEKSRTALIRQRSSPYLPVARNYLSCSLRTHSRRFHCTLSCSCVIPQNASR